jgi:hypothetical protein
MAVSETVTFKIQGHDPMTVDGAMLELLGELVADVADLNELQPSRAAVAMLEQRLRNLERESDALQTLLHSPGTGVEDIAKAAERKARKTTVDDIARAVRGCLKWMRRQVVIEQLGRYATGTAEEPIDRARQLDTHLGDAYRMFVTAQVEAEANGNWEACEEQLKAASGRLAAAIKLAGLVKDGLLRHQSGAQLALPLDGGHE